MKTASDLISRSVSHNEIVTVDYTDDLAESLLVCCEDNTHGNTEIEYWGTTDDGNDWRVHLKGKVVEAKRFADADDSLDAACVRYAAEFGLDPSDMAAHWVGGEDGQRDEIAVYPA